MSGEMIMRQMKCHHCGEGSFDPVNGHFAMPAVQLLLVKSPDDPSTASPGIQETQDPPIVVTIEICDKCDAVRFIAIFPGTLNRESPSTVELTCPSLSYQSVC